MTCGRWHVFCVVDDRRWAGGGRFRGLRAHGGYWRGCGRRAWGLLELLEHATEWASSWDPAPTPAPSAQLLAAQLQLEPLWPAGWVFKLKSNKFSSFHPLASQLVPLWPNSAPSYSNVLIPILYVQWSWELTPWVRSTYKLNVFYGCTCLR